MNHPKLWHKSTLLWVFIIAAINGINAISLVSTSPIVATATANPIFQRNSTGKRFKFEQLNRIFRLSLFTRI